MFNVEVFSLQNTYNDYQRNFLLLTKKKCSYKVKYRFVTANNTFLFHCGEVVEEIGNKLFIYIIYNIVIAIFTNLRKF